MIASPEYGHSLPGVLRNAFDWVIGSGELLHHPFATVGTTIVLWIAFSLSAACCLVRSLFFAPVLTIAFATMYLAMRTSPPRLGLRPVDRHLVRLAAHVVGIGREGESTDLDRDLVAAG